MENKEKQKFYLIKPQLASMAEKEVIHQVRRMLS